MDRHQQIAEEDRLRAEVEALEERAGLTKVMERAREGRFIPLGALGEDVTPEEYFADEHDHLRTSTRDAYFSVSDIALRKQLIAAARRVDNFHRKSLQENVIAANRAVSAAAAQAQRQPWGKAALLGAALVAIGYWAFGTVGAMGAAVAGFFLGQGLIANARNIANAELAQASDELAQTQRHNAEESLMPEFFSSGEEMSGERDARIDDKSGYVNTLQKQRAG